MRPGCDVRKASIESSIELKSSSLVPLTIIFADVPANTWGSAESAGCRKVTLGQSMRSENTLPNIIDLYTDNEAGKIK